MDKQFKFPLEKLLEMRKTREEEGKKLFNSSQRELQISKDKLNELHDNYNKYNGITPGESLVYQKLKKNYLMALNKGILQTEKEIEKKQKEVDYRREQLKIRQIERKTVDILREKRYNQFIWEQNYKEQIQNDEFALYAHMRKVGKEVNE